MHISLYNNIPQITNKNDKIKIHFDRVIHTNTTQYN